jgi:hypothetical protein
MSLTEARPLLSIGLVFLALASLMTVLELWPRLRRSPDLPDRAEQDSIASTKGYRRCLAAAAMAEGSLRDWDYGVRPVLGELVEQTVLKTSPGADPRVAGRELLGEQLWRLVDREALNSECRVAPGPGSGILDEIIDRVERHVTAS